MWVGVVLFGVFFCKLAFKGSRRNLICQPKMSFCTDPESACLGSYVIHTITGLVKRWLRELPDPLMTFDLYTDFLHAAGTLNCSNKINLNINFNIKIAVYIIACTGIGEHNFIKCSKESFCFHFFALLFYKP